ncbi:wd-repeat protein 18 [Holotrichia oblita]|uniref:Wd-repeat protein 18 n=1 Tax=Holotrichia oblita TaxID=644536 RepID=A0ACB9TD16_HOLOL|nr:wd-repeat protein 18 [Holotrichia oblita]
MDTDLELLLGSYQQNQNTSICAWNYNTGNVEHVYKSGGTALPKTLCVISSDYLLTAEQDKPLLHIWPVNSQEQVKNIRFVLPDVVSSIDIDSYNNYIAAGIGLKLYVWHLNSGRLINILQKHYQPITCVKFSSDSSYVLAGGQDGMLVAYKLENVVSYTNSYVSQKNVGECEALYTKMDHSAQITHIHIGTFGRKSKFATTSYDCTCRIYMLQNGTLLLNLILNEPLTYVLMDTTCWIIYIGTKKGSIQRVNLRNPPRSVEYYVDQKYQDIFSSHQKSITCMDLNQTNEVLASGSEDGFVILWDIATKNILRKIERSGAITNLKFVLKYLNFNTQSLKSNIILQPLQKNVDINMRNFVVYASPNQVVFDDEVEKVSQESVPSETLENAQTQINDLKIINKQLYDAFIKMAKKYNS